MKNPKFQVFTGKNGEYYFHLRAENGEIRLGSEGYVSKQGCLKGIDSVKENADNDMRYERKDVALHYRFNLKARNGEIIGRSQSYKSRAGREIGIESVKNNAADAPVEDLT